jgi:hypothetical protein
MVGGPERGSQESLPPAYSDNGNRGEQTLQGAGCKIVLRLGDNNDMATITNEGNTGF